MIPKDPVILLSFVNTQLRDKSIDLNNFCIEYNVNEEDIKKKLEQINYYYSNNTNQFV